MTSKSDQPSVWADQAIEEAFRSGTLESESGTSSCGIRLAGPRQAWLFASHANSAATASVTLWTTPDATKLPPLARM